MIEPDVKVITQQIVILNEVKNLLFIIDLTNRETLHCVQGDTFLRLLHELHLTVFSTMKLTSLKASFKHPFLLPEAADEGAAGEDFFAFQLDF